MCARPSPRARIGQLALDAPTALTEEQWTGMFRRTVGTDQWPAVDFRATATRCSTGEPVVWTAADGVDLSLAVASSCAVPGLFPPVRIGEDHYMDGFRGTDYHALIVGPLELDAAVYIGPKIAAVPEVVKMLERDMDAIAARGTRVHTMLGSEQLDAAGLNLMDFSARSTGFEIGLADGRAQAGAIAEVLGMG